MIINLLLVISLINCVFLFICSIFVDQNGGIAFLGSSISSILIFLLLIIGVISNIAIILNKENKNKILPYIILGFIAVLFIPYVL